MYEGTIKFSLQRRGEDFLSGGIIEFFPDASYPKKKSYAVFVTKGIPVALGQEMSIPKTRVLFQPIPRNKGVSYKCNRINFRYVYLMFTPVFRIHIILLRIRFWDEGSGTGIREQIPIFFFLIFSV